MSRLFPSCRGFLLAFLDAVAQAVDDGDVGVMGEPVQKRCDAGGVGEDLVPFLEGTV
jgi:hypothetical protein